MQPNQPIPVTEPDVVHPPTPIEEPQPDKGPDLPQPGPDVVVPPGPEVITPPQPQEIPPERPAEYRRRCTVETYGGQPLGAYAFGGPCTQTYAVAQFPAFPAHPAGRVHSTLPADPRRLSARRAGLAA